MHEALTHALDIASALEHAHGHGVVHRDLKPANVMLTASGAKLLDFGVAKFRSMPDADAKMMGPSGGVEGEEGNASRAGAVIGTARYMAPEQIEGRDVDGRSDLFSFGAVLFEMLTGERAFVGDNPITVRTAIIHHEPPAVSSCQPQVPAAVDDVVRRCLSKHPAGRWQSASEVVAALRPILDSAIEAAASGSRATARWQRSRALTFAGVILCTILAALGAWAIAGGLLRSSRGGAGEIRSIAVLPLQSVSNDPDEEYFADGTTERLIADLATVNRIRDDLAYVRHALQTPTCDGADNCAGTGGRRDRSKAPLPRRAIPFASPRDWYRGVSGDILWTQSFTAEQQHVLGLTSEMAQAITHEHRHHADSGGAGAPCRRTLSRSRSAPRGAAGATSRCQGNRGGAEKGCPLL